VRRTVTRHELLRSGAPVTSRLLTRADADEKGEQPDGVAEEADKENQNRQPDPRQDGQATGTERRASASAAPRNSYRPRKSVHAAAKAAVAAAEDASAAHALALKFAQLLRGSITALAAMLGACDQADVPDAIRTLAYMRGMGVSEADPVIHQSMKLIFSGDLQVRHAVADAFVTLYVAGVRRHDRRRRCVVNSLMLRHAMCRASPRARVLPRRDLI
jgi:hypothetical protein